jgi:hypothetical protein
MKKKPRNLKSIALQVFELCLEDKWRPNTRDIMYRFKINKLQARTVKTYARAIADSLNTGWDWDPEVGYFRVPPTPEIAKRMGQYRVQHAIDSLKSADHFFSGAHKQGHFSPNLTKSVSNIAKPAIKQLKIIEEDIKAV